MNFYKASENNIEVVKRIVYETINTIYPKYYPMEIVDFFLSHHNDESILQDLKSQNIYLLEADDIVVGTGSIQEGNHICRVFVLPAFQKRGYGSFIMEHLENIISSRNSKAVLDSSLPAYGMYLKRGYRPVDYKSIITPNGFVLCYNVMEKQLVNSESINL